MRRLGDHAVPRHHERLRPQPRLPDVHTYAPARWDSEAALRFLRKATGHNGTPKKITIDKSETNTLAIECYNAALDAEIEIRRVKYLNKLSNRTTSTPSRS
jgi:transposase-like protein